MAPKIALSKSLAWTKRFQEIHSKAMDSQAHTNALLQKMAAEASGSRDFNVLLFSSEAEAEALSYLIQKYNYEGFVRVSGGLAKEEQRALKDKAKLFLFPMAPKSKKIALSKSLAWTKGFQEIYSKVMESQAHTNALLQKMAAEASGSRDFNVLLFSSEAEAEALSYLIQQYNYEGLVRVSCGLAKEEQRALKDMAKELDLPLRE